MTPLMATAPVLASATPSNLSTQAVQLEKMALTESAPWMYSALAQIRELEHSGEVKPGIGDLRVADRTATTARLLLSLINLADLPIPVVSPVSGGSISMVWSMGTKEVKFSCFPDGQTIYFMCEDDEILEDGEVNLGAATSARTPLNWMIQP
jgi:hypothetical protein